MPKKRRGNLAIACVVCILIVAGCTGHEPPTVHTIMRKLGYLTITPPSRLHKPGAINTVEFLNGGKVALHPTCNIGPELLEGNIKESITSDAINSRELNKKLDISGYFFEDLAPEAGIELVESAIVKLNNPRILVITDETLLRIRHAILKDDCAVVVKDSIKNGGRVCQTREVLEAEVVYEIRYKKNVSVKARDKFMSKTAARLKLKFTQDGMNQISAKQQLFYGIKLAPEAVFLNSPGAESAQCAKLDLTSTSQW